MPLPQVLHYAALAAGYLLAFARLTDKARPLWSFLPAKLQPFLPAVLVVLPDLAAGLQGGKTIEDLLGVLLTAGGAFLVAIRGAVPAAHFEQLSPSAKKEIAAVRGSDQLPPVGPALALLLAASLALGGGTGCSNLTSVPDPTKDPAGAVKAVAHDSKAIHAGAVLVVRVIDDLTSRWLDKVTTEQELVVGRKAVALLGESRDILNAWSGADADLVTVAGKVSDALNLLASVGQGPPREARPVLEMLQAFASERGAS